MNTLIVLGVVFLIMVVGIVFAKLEDSNNPKVKKFLKHIGVL